ncbi:transforming growth factor beta superfamily signaling ligand [Ciona intestinalis]
MWKRNTGASVTSWSSLLTLFSISFMFLAPRTMAGCGVNFDKMRKRRIEAVRGQILSKLGLTELPNAAATPRDVPREVEALYNRTRDFVLEQARQQRQECLDPEETYYAEDVLTVYMKNVQPQSALQPDRYKGYKLSRGLSEFYDFDLTATQVNPDSIVSATLRLYQVQNPGSRGERNQVELYQLQPPEKEGLTPVKRYLDMKLMDTGVEAWQSFDVTSTVREWVQFPHLNDGLELTIPCLDEDNFSGTQKRRSLGPRKTLDVIIAGPGGTRTMSSRGDQDPENFTPDLGREFYPHLVIMVRTPANQGSSRTTTNSRRRRKRALDADYCFNRNPSETNCCLRELYIDFRRDLEWNWVRAPVGYKANFCAGACPYLWSMDTQHATILGLYKSMNPHASSAPCCTPKELDPLILMYYANNEFKFTKMSDMVLLSCKCS